MGMRMRMAGVGPDGVDPHFSQEDRNETKPAGWLVDWLDLEPQAGMGDRIKFDLCIYFNFICPSSLWYSGRLGWPGLELELGMVFD